MSLLSVENVNVYYGDYHALRNVSLNVLPGETLALVGESGCGKTTLARTVLGLQPYTGSIRLGDQLVEGVSKGQAERVGIVWQDPYASLDRRWRVDRLIQEPGTATGKSVNAGDLLTEVGLDPQFGQRYPHQMSGGQRQRVAIARALAMHPPLVICDEPTAALDLSVQAQVINLLKDIQVKEKCSYLYISHDLLTVNYLADRVAVMYLGEIVEEGKTEEVFNYPRHPYTQMLLNSMLSHERIGELPDVIESELGARPLKGCVFAPRCPYQQADCLAETISLSNGVACLHPLGAKQ